MNAKTKSNLMLVVTALIWGSAFVAQSVGMDYLGPFTFNSVRCFLGGLILLPVIKLFDMQKKNGAADARANDGLRGATQNAADARANGGLQPPHPDGRMGKGFVPAHMPGPGKPEGGRVGAFKLLDGPPPSAP